MTILTPIVDLDSIDSKVSQEELDRLLNLAIQHDEHHKAFFRALLDATVYGHLPLSDDSGRIRFVQFNSPDDGRALLPFFTDLDKALAVGRTDVRILALLGRTLLQITRGATLIMNPNDQRSILYPEEVKTLLETGNIAQIWCEVPTETRDIAIQTPARAPKWLIEKIRETERLLLYVKAAYLIECWPPGSPERADLRLSLAVTKDDAERAVRAVTVHLGPRLSKLKLPLVMMTFEPTESRPSWLPEGYARCIFDSR